MLTDKKIFGKIKRIKDQYAQLMFEPVMDVSEGLFFETKEHFRQPPTGKSGSGWKKVKAGYLWGGNWLTAWFFKEITLPDACKNQRVFLQTRDGHVDGLILINNQPKGVFDWNHHFVLIDPKGIPGKKIDFHCELYAGTPQPGCGPYDNLGPIQKKAFQGFDLLIERKEVRQFVYDLTALIQLAEGLDENNLRKARIIRSFSHLFAWVDAMPTLENEKSWRPKLKEALSILQPLLLKKNGPTAPSCTAMGHSHLDTAWLWTLEETRRKAARTFSSVLNLMDQYPDFKFLQSQPCHMDTIKNDYPDIFNRVKEKVKQGRWEPNGGMWVEADCNIASGESLVRQFLFGIRSTQEWFNYRSDALWLPDVFGYSAALPQILKGFGIKYFNTVKISWNDTTRFPYDTFIWKGIDGSSVLAQFNYNYNFNLEPKALIENWNWVQHKDVQESFFCSFGHGDGGGGPNCEMLEMAKRMKDLEGCPKTEIKTLSTYMKSLEKTAIDLPEWNGELYFELHRGTYTSIAGIKRGNRKTELALRDAEIIASMATLQGVAYPKKELDGIWKRLLTRQFHDILPGSSIKEVNIEAIRVFDQSIFSLKVKIQDIINKMKTKGEKRPSIAIANTLSWTHNSEITIDAPTDGAVPEPAKLFQTYSDQEGRKKIVFSGIELPPLSIRTFGLKKTKSSKESPFLFKKDSLVTPFYKVRFDDRGRIISLWHRESARELVKEDGVFNAFITSEDVPDYWDSWDIDKDQELKRKDNSVLISRECVSQGPLQIRIRGRFKIGSGSELTQDMVFHSGNGRIDFETKVDWREKKTLLKTHFDFNLVIHSARYEIQFGYAERPTHTNLKEDRARFEVAQQKWTDFSEQDFGIALLNDCKYGIGVHNSSAGLTLIKSGTHPDPRGDEGIHLFNYALLPHNSGFSTTSVIRPAYEFNIPPVTSTLQNGIIQTGPLVKVDFPNVIVETVKLSEDGKALVIRLYESQKSAGNVQMKMGFHVKEIYETDLMEENKVKMKISDQSVKFKIKPFEIKTFYCLV